MSIAVYMPELGESVTEGTVTHWLKSIGDTVTVDEPLVEVATDKVDTEIPSPAAGVLLEICAWEDDTIPVGELLARLGDSDEMSNLSIADTTAFDLLSDNKSATRDNTAPETPTANTANADTTNIDTNDGRSDSVTVTLPNLGESVTSGTVTRWHKQVGDTIHADEPLVEIATDKVDTEIPSPLDGRIVEIYTAEDETVKVGAPIALISSVLDTKLRESKTIKPMPIIPEPSFADVHGTIPLADEQENDRADSLDNESAEDVTSSEDAATEEAPSGGTPAQDGSVIGSPLRGSSDHSYISPLVRKLAAEYGLNLAEVKGTGLGGRIRKQDIVAAAAEKKRRTEQEQLAQETAEAATPQAPSRPAGEIRGTVQSASVIRQATAESALYAARNTAVVSQTMEVDLTNALRQLAAQNNAGTSLNQALRGAIAYAVARILRHHPDLNASYGIEENDITYHSSVNLSVRIDTADGLISPIIHDAQTLPVSDIIAVISALKERSLSDSLTPADLSGGTFTLVSTNTPQLLWETPLVIPPQSAALSVGSLVQRPTVLTNATGSSIAIRAISYFTLSFDTCLIDSPVASRFLAEVKDVVEDASFLDDLNDVDALD